MRLAVLPLLLALTLLPPVGARAESLHELAAGGRYQLMEVNDRIVRLDTETGRFELCRADAGDWTCTVTRDERAELEARIAALTRRVEALEAERQARATAPVAPTAETTLPPAAETVVASSATVPDPVTTGAIATGPVPPVEVGRSEGEPMVIAPSPPAPEKRGIIRRLTDLVPGLGW